MSITIDNKIKDLCLVALGPPSKSQPVKDNTTGTILVLPKPTRNAKWRFLAYRFRRYLHDDLPEKKRPEHGYYLLSTSQEQGLEALARKLTVDIQKGKTILEHVESVFHQSRNYQPDTNRVNIQPAQQRLNRGRFNPTRNRLAFIWDILWGLTAITDKVVDFQGVLNIPLTGLDNEFFELIERRLHKLERMRYNVPGVGGVGDTDPVEVPNMILFCYPDSDDCPIETCSIGGESYNPATDENSDWEHYLRAKQNAYACDFRLIASDPRIAIERIFNVPLTSGGTRRDDSAKTRNYCDKVIQILHLEEVVDYLRRTARSDISLNPLKVLIVSSFTWVDLVGSGKSNPDDMDSTGDPFFEQLEVRIDELIPGDHFILRNHPIYQALVGEGAAWRLENALVSRIRGRSLPSDIEVEGHGLGPYPFRSMQADLLAETRNAIKHAQDALKNSSALSYTKAASKSGHRFVHWFSQNQYEGPIEFRNEFLEYPENVALLQDIRQDPQLSNTKKEQLIEKVFKLGFAVRCHLIPRKPSFGNTYYPINSFFSFFEDKYINSLYVDPTNKQRKDRTVNAAAWELPFISNIIIRVAERKLVLEGHNLLKDRVRGVYFVAYPRYHVDLSATPQIQLSSNSEVAQLGKWIDPNSGLMRFVIVEDDKLTYLDQGKKLEVDIPTDFGSEEFWRPVLRVSMFDPADPELERYFPNDDIGDKPIDWFEGLDETNNATLKRLKDGIAALQFDVRAEFAFHWPYSGQNLELRSENYIDSNPPGIFQFPVEGHGFFNVILFPLFRKRTISGAELQEKVAISHVNLRLTKAFLAGQISRFFNEHVPEGHIKVIRPKYVQPSSP